MIAFKEHLRQIRKSKKATQKDVANAVGVTERNYQDWEYGKIKPGFDALIALADYFDVPMDYLLSRGIFENWDQIIQYKEAIVALIAHDTKLDVSRFDDAAFMRVMYAIVDKVEITESSIYIFYDIGL